MFCVRLPIRSEVFLAVLSLVARAAMAQTLPSPRAAPDTRERTLLLVGDVMLARGVGAKMKTAGDWTLPFEKIAPTLRAADLAFGNLECPVSDVGRDLHHLYSFRADPRAIEGLKYAGFGVLSLANNHIDDWGRPAVVDSLERLRAAGIRPVGAGSNDLEAHSPVVVNLNGVRLAFLAFVNIEPELAAARADLPGVAWLRADRALVDIRFARALADLVIVSLHWGVEYAKSPQAKQVELAHRMIDAGADLIVGHHPHVVQPVEKYHERWIAYSLGNFVFDQKGQPTHHGIMLNVKLRDKQIAEVTSVPITIDRNFQASVTPLERPAPGARPAGLVSRTVRPQ